MDNEKLIFDPKDLFKNSDWCYMDIEPKEGWSDFRLSAMYIVVVLCVSKALSTQAFTVGFTQSVMLAMN